MPDFCDAVKLEEDEIKHLCREYSRMVRFKLQAVEHGPAASAQREVQSLRDELASLLQLRVAYRYVFGDEFPDDAILNDMGSTGVGHRLDMFARDSGPPSANLNRDEALDDAAKWIASRLPHRAGLFRSAP